MVHDLVWRKCSSFYLYTAWLESIFIQDDWCQYSYSLTGVNTVCPQVFSSGGTCTLLPSFLGVHSNFRGCPVTLYKYWLQSSCINIDSGHAVWILTPVMLYKYWLQSCCINIDFGHAVWIYTAWPESIVIQHDRSQYLYSMTRVNIHTAWLESIFIQHDQSQYSYSMTRVKLYKYWLLSCCININSSHAV
jgi:hypothetical protein